MTTDIILDEQFVALQGDFVDVRAPALVLDAITDRTDPKLDTEVLRRPLVHDADDSLTINWRNHYSGGVSVYGRVSISGTLLLSIDSTATSGPGISPPASGLSDAEAPPSPAAYAPMMMDPFSVLVSHLHRSPIDLASEIVALRQLILNLNERVKTLEAK